jgi:DNA-binding transcriptional ArsR family regulator
LTGKVFLTHYGGVSLAGAPPVADVFGVAAHPVRRAILQRLATGEKRVTDLAVRLPVSRPAVSQHLKLMLEVGVVTERRAGRERYYALRREPLRDMHGWLASLDSFWAGGLDRLGVHLDGQS